ncbi:TonB-dependent siderophore receptor [Salinisphaera sp. T31B1]
MGGAWVTGLLVAAGLGHAGQTLAQADQPAQRLAPLVVSGSGIAGADEPTQGYVVDSSQGATKTDTPLIRTPQTVDVVTRDQIEDQGALTVNNALRYTPGVFTGLAGSSSRQTTVSLRGFPGGDVNNTFLDGLRLANDAGAYSNIQIDPFFLERIDVVKGPSSVLYGRAQPGGLVNFVTKKPQAEQQGLVRFYGGSFDTFGGGFDVTGALPDAALGSYRVVASAETSDTQYDVVKSERYTIMPEVSLNLAEDTTLLLQAYIQREPDGGFHGSVPYDLSVSSSRFGRTVDDEWVDTSEDFEKFDRDTEIFSYQLTHQVSDDVTLRSKAQYTEVDVDLEQVYQNGFTGNGAELLRYATAAREHLKGFAVDNNARFDFATGAIDHTVLTGFDFQRRENRVRYGGAAATNLDPFNPDYDNAVSGDAVFAPADIRQTRQIGLYLQDQLEWNRWNLVLGGRQDYLKREYTIGGNQSRVQRSDDAFSGRAALLYQSAFGLSPYISYSEAFNPSAYSPASGTGQISEPVDSDQVEVGLKYQPPGLDALFTLALYDLNQNNVQQRTGVTPVVFTSIGDVQSQGVELSGRANLTDRLHVIASYSHSEVEYQDDVTSDGLDVRAGNTFVRTPDDLASAWVSYDLPRGINAGAGVRYVGSSYADSANTREVPDYTLADASVSFELGEFVSALDDTTLRINANNLFDKEYVEACFSEINCYYGQARTITATVDYRF